MCVCVCVCMYVCLQALMATKCTKFLFCRYVVTSYIDNTHNTNRKIHKLVFQKISTTKFIDRNNIRQLITRVTLRHYHFWQNKKTYNKKTNTRNIKL